MTIDTDLEITFHEVEHSDAVEARVREKVAELLRIAPRLTRCRVAISAPHQRHNKGTLYCVRIDLHGKNAELAVSRQHRHDHAHEDVYTAIRDAFAAARRQLEEYVSRQRREVKRHEAPEHGRITKLFRDDGYGFIETADGTEVCFHENAVSAGSFLGMHVGLEVRLEFASGERGPQATSVSPIGKHHIPASTELAK
jgi:cold shock CspA family protein/ribosome-associated translation inhibitor RaiA